MLVRPGGVQLLVLLDERLDRQRRRRRQLDQRLGAIDQLAVQLALRVARDASARLLRRLLRDVPLPQRRGVEDVFVAAAHEDDRVRRRHGVQIARDTAADAPSAAPRASRCSRR